MRIVLSKLEDISLEYVRNHINYDKETGILKRKCMGNPRTPGIRIDHEGYIQVYLLGRYFRAAWLVWFYMTGEWPTQFVDHINRNRKDNRWANLRDVSRKINAENHRCYDENGKPFP